MSSIVDVSAREILDSRGNPTVEVEVELLSGARGRAAVPSGASTGAHEAVELRDGGERYGGKGVRRAVAHVEGEIADALLGIEALDQRDVDRILIELDGTDGKARLGANALLGVSLAVAKAGADESDLPLYRYVGGTNAHVLPMPCMNVLNGGAHADSNVDLQEFMLAPVGAASFSEALRMGTETYHALKKSAARARALHRGRRRRWVRAQPAVERRGGHAAARGDHRRRLRPGDEIAIALDAASTEFFADGVYDLAGEGRKFTLRRVRRLPRRPVRRYPIVSIEDGMAEDDWDGWARSPRRSATGCSSSATTCS